MVISYETGTPIRLKAGDVAKLAGNPKRYSVFNSRPSNVRVMHGFGKIEAQCDPRHLEKRLT